MSRPLLTELEIILLETSYRQTQKERISTDHNDQISSCAHLLLKGEFEQLLCGDVAKAILGSSEENLSTTSNVAEYIQTRVHSYLQAVEHGDSINSRELDVMYVGIACLQLFLQCNWTGPPCKMIPTDVLPACLNSESNLTSLREFAVATLGPDDTSVYPLVAHPEFLLMAHCILGRCKAVLSSCLTADWWLLRCLWIQQQLLDERSPLIYKEACELMESIGHNEILMSRDKCNDLPVIFHLECSHICQYFYEYTAAKEHLNTAKKLLGVEVSLSGALGKRTRFQQTDKAQLFLNIQRQTADVPSSTPTRNHHHAVTGLPKDLNLNDDTILETIQFQDSNAAQVPVLSGAEQALILALCLEHKRSRPREELLLEELKAYTVAAITRPQIWSIQSQTLMTRCQIERDHGRRVERAMGQMQVLVDQFQDAECPLIDRLELLHAVCLQPKWKMESELASLLMSLGVISAALEIYIRLELWEEVVKCYQLLEKPEKAMKVVHDQLAIKETPTLWCMLGDLKKDKQHYEKAWELSGHQSARAMRSLGLIYLEQEDWTKSIECLHVSLQKNPVQYSAWFLLGYSATQAKDYETAARAYRKCVTLECDNGKAWNNLSTAYINLKQKPRAFKTLQEAIRCLYENWRIWENYMLVSVDVGEFNEAIKAYHRLLELKEKYMDEEVLEILVKAVTNNINDADGKPANCLKGKLAELFGRITSQVTTNAHVWKLYAHLHGNATSDSPDNNDKALQCLQKAYRLQTHRDNWSHDVQSCNDILAQSVQLAQAYHYCSNQKSNSTEAMQLLSSAKLMLKSVVSKVKQQHPDDSMTWADLCDLLTSAETELHNIITAISERKDQP